MGCFNWLSSKEVSEKETQMSSSKSSRKFTLFGRKTPSSKDMNESEWQFEKEKLSTDSESTFIPSVLEESAVILDKPVSEQIFPIMTEAERSLLQTHRNEYGDVELQTAAIQILPVKDSDEWLITVAPPATPRPSESAKRSPCDMVVIMDVSSSMDTKIWQPHTRNRHNRTQLGVAQEAVKLIVDHLTEEDRIAVLTFAKNSEVVQPLEEAKDVTKTELSTKIGSLGIRDGSNLFDALQAGLDLFKSPKTNDRTRAMYVFTDGRAGTDTSAKYVKMLRSKLEELDAERGNAPIISTFGFGFRSHGDVLYSIARVGNGCHTFIADEKKMRGSVVAAIGNTFNTFATSAKLKLEWIESNLNVEVPAYLEPKFSSKTIDLDLGVLQYHQKRSFLAELKGVMTGALTVTLDYQTMVEGKKQSATHELGNVSIYLPDGPWIAFHRYREQLCNLLWYVFPKRSDGHKPNSASTQSFMDQTNALLNDIEHSRFRSHAIVCDCDATLCSRDISHRIDAMFQDIAGETPDGSISQYWKLNPIQANEFAFYGQALGPLLCSHILQVSNSLVHASPLRYALDTGDLWQQEAEAVLNKLPKTKGLTDGKGGCKLTQLDRWQIKFQVDSASANISARA